MEVFIEFYNPALHFYDRLKALQTFQSWVIKLSTALKYLFRQMIYSPGGPRIDFVTLLRSAFQTCATCMIAISHFLVVPWFSLMCTQYSFTAWDFSRVLRHQVIHHDQSKSNPALQASNYCQSEEVAACVDITSQTCSTYLIFLLSTK